jgi:hypothetical protein
MPRRSYTAYTRTGTPTTAMHLSFPNTARTLCGQAIPSTAQVWLPGIPDPLRFPVCRDCKDWAYPQDPHRNR